MLALTKKILTFAAVVAMALSSQTATAEFTKFDADYDAYSVIFQSSVATLRELVAVQKDDWLTTQFQSTETQILGSIKAGTITMSEYLQKITAFIAKAETKYTDFSRTASSAFSATSNAFNEYSKDAPEPWCDFVFDTLRAAAKDVKNPAIEAKVNAANKEIEQAIKTKASGDVINDKLVALYTEANELDATYLDLFDAKVNALNEKFETESKQTAIKKEDATDEKDATAAPTTMADAGVTIKPENSTTVAPSSGSATGPVSSSGSTPTATPKATSAASTMAASGGFALVAVVVATMASSVAF